MSLVHSAGVCDAGVLQGSRAVPRAPLGGRGPGSASASAIAAFHVELTETCLDLLARYTSTPCSVKPHRYVPPCRRPGAALARLADPR